MLLVLQQICRKSRFVWDFEGSWIPGSHLSATLNYNDHLFPLSRLVHMCLPPGPEGRPLRGEGGPLSSPAVLW